MTEIVEFPYDRSVNRFGPTYSIRENGEFWKTSNGSRRAWSTYETAEKARSCMKTKIHINQHVIRKNAKTGERSPVITVKTYKTNDYCTEVTIQSPCKVIYSPDKPLPCGAKVWIETEGEVICHA